MIFARHESRELMQAGVDGEVFYLRSRISPRQLWKDVVAFRHRVREFRPNLIHAQFGTMTAFFAAFATRTPAVVTYRGTDLNPDPSQTRFRSFLGRTLSRLAAAKAAGIVCVTSQLRSRLWWGRERAVVLPGSVDLDRFLPCERKQARAALGWDADEFVVLFNLGRFPKVKRPDLAAAAVNAAAAEVGPIRLHVMDGSIDQATVPLLMNASDSLIITSVCEGSPTILREALACNLPVVTVDVGDVRERLEGVTESHVVSRDMAELGGKLAEVLRRRQRSNGREAVQRLSVPQFTRDLAKLYRRALVANGKIEEAALLDLSLNTGEHA